MKGWIGRAGVLLAGIAILGCEDLLQEPDTGIAQRLTLVVVSGNQQTGVPGQPLPQPLRVRLDDLMGGPVERLMVEWRALEGSGRVEPRYSFTDEEGVAEATWILGPEAGRQRVTATFSDDVKTFEAQAEP